jgi:hypothetical protein
MLGNVIPVTITTIKKKNMYARSVQTLFAINPESKNINVENGRSSDLLPLSERLPDFQ